MRERLLDPVDQHVLPAGRRLHAAEDRRPADRRLRAARRIDGGELAREVVLEQRIVVRRLEQVLDRSAPAPALPSFSWTFGPVGTVGAAGAGPRSAGTSSHTIVTLSRSQSHGSPVGGVDAIAFPRSPLSSCRSSPSATHNSMAVSFVCRNASRDPSGENFTLEIARLRRHRHRLLGAAVDLLQRDRVDAGARQPGRAMRTVGLRVDARAGQPHIGCASSAMVG